MTSARAIRTVHTVAALRDQVRQWRAAGERVALVPTMGALHAGHVALMDAGRALAQRVIVSIFVNPTQFAPTEDLSRYPRTLEADLATADAAGVDLAFVPDAGQMYPEGFATTIALTGPALGLESDFRPTHFAGVATVVAKLLIQSQPDVALFGEKDYQQLQVVSRLVRDLDLPVDIVGVPTVREADGLALSSRNVFLRPEERAAAPALHRALRAAAAAIAEGGDITTAVDEARACVATAGFQLDYLDARHAMTLARVTSHTDGPIRLLVAARIGATRLIDNLAVPN
ncbi:pantoate--beta-alanine ligase [Ancylobacter dichloromethanicus]|uniref:Pantothenate synthetase n=1 Tax=Ancylobacter dichloromethanicus TaxID=518825 RepID=A0A9W6J9K7_9HYPH|nr:pantoate--beta-alanine ligase [Ancylobacter dichloromethanicus]MBS7554664.1 pantoate--beta-alanine ligase [Ancylobacter dichloromethanicus]GLK71795.1 pantothenate synthetase [Ancylobacter dichloromethanicus]